jgi:parallel beta-helix repeat protein
MHARAFALTAVSAVFFAGHAAAGTVYVGECVPDGTHLPTIQQAVDAVSNPGTVKVCPGNYAEQVVIDGKNVTLTGLVNVSDSSAVRLVAPAGGLVQNTVSVFDGVTTYAAQVVVRNGATATVSNLIVDGANNQVPGCGSGLVGIIFQNASGSVSGNIVTNHVQSAGLEGCQTGLGFYAQNDGNQPRAITVSDNYVDNFQKNGITGNGSQLTMTLTGNTVAGKGPTTGAAQNAIQLGFGATGSISKNYVSGSIWAPLQPNDPGNAASGILVYAAPNVVIDANVVQTAQYGIAVVGDEFSGHADGAVVTRNRVADTRVFDGIDICGSGNAIVEKNVVLGSDEAGIHIDSSCGTPSTGNSVKGNTIRGGCAGLLIGAGSSASNLGSNKVFNADTRQVDDSDVCPVAGMRAPKPKATRPGQPRRGSPVR